MVELVAEKHIQYIISVEKKKDALESVATEHLRINGAYWGLTTLDLLGKLQVVDQDEVIPWVMQCQHESGGFGGNIGHDPHILYTLSAVQILALFDKVQILDVAKVTNYIVGLQNEDGSFSGDMWEEVDTRFSYIAVCCLSLLRQLDKIDVESAVNYIVRCKNLDGGFGCTPGGESHAGQRLIEELKEGMEKMDTTRRAMESYWTSRMIDATTSDGDKVKPVFKLEEIYELLRSSSSSIVKQVSEFLFKRLDHKNSIC